MQTSRLPWQPHPAFLVWPQLWWINGLTLVMLFVIHVKVLGPVGGSMRNCNLLPFDGRHSHGQGCTHLAQLQMAVLWLYAHRCT